MIFIFIHSIQEPPAAVLSIHPLYYRLPVSLLLLAEGLQDRELDVGIGEVIVQPRLVQLLALGARRHRRSIIGA